MALPQNNLHGYMQADWKRGEVLCQRAGIHGGIGAGSKGSRGNHNEYRLNRRRRGTVHEIEEWIKYYRNKLAKGDYCPKRAAKIISRFEKALEHAKETSSH
jgi:hypothetical protein